MIDLRSDTVTTPSPAMRRVMAEAEVGDDVYGEDPSVNALEAYAAELLNKQAALLLPSGTMANLVAYLSQTRPGDTIIMSESAHPFHYECANVAMVAGLLVRTIEDDLGKFTVEQARTRILRKDDPHLSVTTLMSVENTTNRGGGACWQFHEFEPLAALCRETGITLHCDGARIFNACASTNVEPRYYAQCCDTLSFCLSKGLGAPAGSVLVGDAATIHQARRYRKMLGGGMRQVGILAAAGHYALKHHIKDLRDDHRRARTFRRALEEEGVTFPLPSPTNIVYMRVQHAASVVTALADWGILALEHGPRQVRVVFHRDIDDAALTQAIEGFKQVLCGRQAPR